MDSDFASAVIPANDIFDAMIFQATSAANRRGNLFFADVSVRPPCRRSAGRSKRAADRLASGTSRTSSIWSKPTGDQNRWSTGKGGQNRR
jgi:hypothetical protein